MSNIIIPVPEGFEVVDIKIQWKPCKIKVAPKEKSIKMCTSCGSKYEDYCLRCFMKAQAQFDKLNHDCQL